MPSPVFFLAPLTAAVLSATARGTAILALAALTAWLLRRRTAALRHLVWTAALGSMIALLVLPAALPAWHILPIPSFGFTLQTPPSAPPAAEPSPAPLSDAALIGDVPPARIATRDGAGSVVAPPLANAGVASHQLPASGTIDWPLLTTALWLLGGAVVASRYAYSRFRLDQLHPSARATPAESEALASSLARQMRISRPVAVSISDEIEIPLTWGLLRPRVVLPSSAAEWTPECRRHVLQHELAHIKRFDAGTQLVAQAASALFWFHPLVWYAVGHVRRERERACDDSVLASGASAAAYAGDLLSIVSACAYMEHHSVALAFARRSQFEGRLLAVLDPTVDRGVLSPRRVAAVLAIATACVVPLAAVERADATMAPHASPTAAAGIGGNVPFPTGASSAPLPDVTASRRRPARSHRADASAEDVSDVGATNATPGDAGIVSRNPSGVGGKNARRSAPEDVFAACPQIFNHYNSHYDSDRDSSGPATRWTAGGGNDACSFALNAHGQIDFSADATAIDRIAADGAFDASADIHGDVTQVVVRASSDGALTYEMTRNGQIVDAPDAARAWLATLLIGVDRTVAFAVDRRFTPLFASGGSQAVLDEVDHMHSDQASAVYLLRLAQSARLDPATLAQIGHRVAAMGGNYAEVEVIEAVGRGFALTDSAQRAGFLAGAVSLSADEHRAQALTSLIRNAPLTDGEVGAVLASIAGMRDDGPKSRTLIDVATQRRLDGVLRDAFTAAAETIRNPRMQASALAFLRRR